MTSKWQKYIKKKKDHKERNKEYMKRKDELQKEYYMEAGRRLHVKIEKEAYEGMPIDLPERFKPIDSGSGYTIQPPKSFGDIYKEFLDSSYKNAPAWMKETPKHWDESVGNISKDVEETKKEIQKGMMAKGLWDKFVEAAKKKEEEDDDEWLILN